MKPHRTDGVSLSFGTIFMAIVVWWVVSRFVDLRLPALGWLAAGGLILFGVFGLLSAIRSGRTAQQEPPIQAAVDVDPPGDLPADVHADIVRELLENPADRLPATPVTTPPGAADPTDRTQEFPPHPSR